MNTILPASSTTQSGRWARLTQTLTSQWFIVLAIMALAAFLRFYQLNSIPPGLHYDEAGEALDALNMLHNGPRVFSTTQGGREPLFAWLLALIFLIFEPQVIILRGLGAFSGTLAVGASYLLAREMFKPLMPNRARWVAALTALGMATGYWQVHLTRMGLRHVLLPLLETLAFYFLWRGINQGRRRDFVFAGALVGVSMYTYLSARFIPIFLLIFFIVEGLIQLFKRRPARALVWRYRVDLIFAGAVAFLIFAPLGYYFLSQQPDEFFERSAQVSVFNLALNQGDLPGALRNSIVGNVAALAVNGDSDGLINLPGRPIFGPLMALAFASGYILTLIRGGRPAYLFLALWWPVMLLPAALTYDRVPRFMRALGSVPGIYIIAALTWVSLAGFIIRYGRRLRRPAAAKTAAVLVPLVVYALAGMSTYQDYFLHWGPSQTAKDMFYQAYEDIALKMAQAKSEGALWVFPTDLRINYPRRHRYILRFAGYEQLPPEKFLNIDEEEMFAELTAETAGLNEVVLVNMKRGLQWEADSKHILPFLLEKYGRLTGVGSTEDYDLLTYSLDSSDTNFALAEDWQPIGATFGEGLKLRAAAYGDASGSQPPETPQTPSGETVWAALRWQAPGPMAEDYQASLRLVDETGRVISRIDNPLASRWHLGATNWHPDEEFYDYYLLPLEAGTAPGAYRLEVAVYSPASLQPLPASLNGNTAASAQIGTLTALPALTPPQTLAVGESLDIDWEAGLTLAGFDPPPNWELRPGDTLNLALVWRAEANLPANALLSLTLSGEDENRTLLKNILVGGEAFPTGQWRPGETLRQRLNAKLPPNLPNGGYYLTLSNPVSGRVVNLGTVQAQGRPRQFEVLPEVQNQSDVVLGDKIKLAGYTVDNSGAGQMGLTLYWQTLAEMDESYTVFVHILDENGQIAAQRDQIPLAGQAPTTGWLPGEVIEDVYLFNVPAGSYQAAVGMYNAATGRRLAIPGTPDNRLILPISNW